MNRDAWIKLYIFATTYSIYKKIRERKYTTIYKNVGPIRENIRKLYKKVYKKIKGMKDLHKI